MGLDSVGIDIYDIHGYFCELKVGHARILGRHNKNANRQQKKNKK